MLLNTIFLLLLSFLIHLDEYANYKILRNHIMHQVHKPNLSHYLKIVINYHIEIQLFYSLIKLIYKFFPY